MKFFYSLFLFSSISLFAGEKKNFSLKSQVSLEDDLYKKLINYLSFILKLNKNYNGLYLPSVFSMELLFYLGEDLRKKQDFFDSFIFLLQEKDIVESKNTVNEIPRKSWLRVGAYLANKNKLKSHSIRENYF